MPFCCLNTEKGLTSSSQLRRRLSDVVGRLPKRSGVWPSALTRIGVGQLLPLSGWGKSASVTKQGPEQFQCDAASLKEEPRTRYHWPRKASGRR